MQPLYGKGFQLRQGFDGQVACDRSASFRLLPPSSAFFRLLPGGGAAASFAVPDSGRFVRFCSLSSAWQGGSVSGDRADKTHGTKLGGHSPFLQRAGRSSSWTRVSYA